MGNDLIPRYRTFSVWPRADQWMFPSCSPSASGSCSPVFGAFSSCFLRLHGPSRGYITNAAGQQAFFAMPESHRRVFKPKFALLAKGSTRLQVHETTNYYSLCRSTFICVSGSGLYAVWAPISSPRSPL
ncbi:hypothetical protein BDQ94DRAFT_58209 [Aspergillus welwitschiae]|uniref:Uncharacterized protein n=1 Tax=Aspergillus welwitschiae TaxID=1341132 RepID=A0A3F3PXC9_9EURO|nr:hypothetical protein BDQ94DRAFT_58209 [Aspergillus welwitschiae]RDH31535.1 hypothetical protein BDQ94DRAFT_58209 [Aspergillus welwitschiae]